jgi:hypothetical protein
VTEGEGIWDTVKEILSWIFNGIERTIQLPPKKVTSLCKTIKTALCSGHIEFKAFESVIGKCQHACLGIPGGWSLLPPPPSTKCSRPLSASNQPLSESTPLLPALRPL